MEFHEIKPEAAVIGQLIALSADWEKENCCYGYRRNEKADIEGRRIFAAEDENGIAGYLFGIVEQEKRQTSVMPAGTAYFEVEELYVRPELRSQGIGRRLFALAESTMKKESIGYFMLGTATKNYKAILHFYIEEIGMNFWSARLYKKL